MKDTHNLYKYRAWNRFTEEMLRDNTVYFCPLIDLNDPFEGTFRIEIEEVRKHYARKYAAIKGVSYEEGYKVLIAAEGDGRVEYDKGFVEAVAQIRSNIKILSLSKTNSDVQMWAHYADNHKGICIGFDESITRHKFRLPSRGGDVRYVPELSVMDFVSPTPFESLFQLVYEKKTNWAHEQEYRIVIPDLSSPDGIVGKIPEHTIRSVHLGYRCDQPTEAAVKAYCRIRGLKLYKMEFSGLTQKCHETEISLDHGQDPKIGDG